MEMTHNRKERCKERRIYANKEYERPATIKGVTLTCMHSLKESMTYYFTSTVISSVPVSNESWDSKKNVHSWERGGGRNTSI